MSSQASGRKCVLCLGTKSDALVVGFRKWLNKSVVVKLNQEANSLMLFPQLLENSSWTGKLSHSTEIQLFPVLYNFWHTPPLVNRAEIVNVWRMLWTAEVAMQHIRERLWNCCCNQTKQGINGQEVCYGFNVGTVLCSLKMFGSLYIQNLSLWWLQSHFSLGYMFQWPAKIHFSVTGHRSLVTGQRSQ